jgi:hypothetical protein
LAVKEIICDLLIWKNSVDPARKSYVYAQVFLRHIPSMKVAFGFNKRNLPRGRMDTDFFSP